MALLDKVPGNLHLYIGGCVKKAAIPRICPPHLCMHGAEQNSDTALVSLRYAAERR